MSGEVARTLDDVGAGRTSVAGNLLPILVLILLTVGLRTVLLSGDPPADFSWSGGYFADEGYWSHNARNEVLYGRAVLDEWDARAVSPVFAYFQRTVFHLFGPGIPQVRLVGIFSSLLLTLCTWFICRRRYAENVSFVCALVVGLNFPMLVLGRQGILDPFAAAAAWLALLLLLVPSLPAAFFAGVLLVVSCCTKYLMVYALLPLGVFVVCEGRRGARAMAFAAGVLLAAVIWWTGSFLPNRELLAGYGSYYSSQQSWRLIPVLKNVATQPFFLYLVKTPAVLFFGNLMLWFLLAERVSWEGRRAGVVEFAAGLWLLTGILFFSLWHYRPLRYYTSLIPPLATLAGLALFRLEGMMEAMRDRRRRVWLAAGILLPAAQMILVLADRWAGWGLVPAQLGIHVRDALVFVALSALVPGLLLAGKLRWVPGLFVLAFLAADAGSYVSWMTGMKFRAVEVSRDLQQSAPDGVVAGQWAPEMCLENTLRVVPVWHGFVNSNDPFRKYGITHLLLWRYPLGDELQRFREWYPVELRQFRLLKRYTIKGSNVELYQRVRPETPARAPGEESR